MNKEDNIRDIKLNFKTVGKLDEKNNFQFKVPLRNEKVLGLWLRSDGDDHNGKFVTTIKALNMN